MNTVLIVEYTEGSIVEKDERVFIEINPAPNTLESVDRETLTASCCSMT